MNNITLGFALTGSFCTLDTVMPVMEQLVKEGVNVVPIISFAVANSDTRAGKAQDFIDRITQITGKEPIKTIQAAEPIGPKALLDVLVVAPCTGNTLAKLAHGITDSPVTMACKSHLRNERPLILSVSTNDGLGANATNIGIMLNRHNVYFVPFRQDDPIKKHHSLIADVGLIPSAIEAALEGKQLQPILLSSPLS